VSEPPLVEGEVAPELAEEWPGLRLASTTFAFVPGKSPPELRERLRLLSDRFRGPQAIALRKQPIPQAYRIFFRHIGLEPDERRVPVEALVLERMKHGGFRSRNLLDDAITIAVMETSVPVWALDAAAVEGGLRLRAAEAGEGLPRGRLVVACETRPLAVLFDDVGPDAGVTERTREMVLFSVAVPGVPPIHVEEALWTVWDIVAGD
jgi:DNA/RNA-binding domain of Phe-tRNA-synthetase-like protein